MPRFNLNERIITEIRNSLPETDNIAQALMDILLIGRESVYRRLRGEVQFTFEEVAKVAVKLEFSVDNIIGINDSERAVFDVNLLSFHHEIEDYCSKLKVYIRLFKQMRKFPNNQARYAMNTLPYSFYLAHDNLAKFKYFRWLYQITPPTKHLVYDDVQMPTLVHDLHKSFVAENRYLNKSLIILDRIAFSSIVCDIEYFYKLKIITLDDINALKRELLEMIDELESIAIAGCFKTGNEVLIYLSNVDLEASYCHFEYGDRQYSHLRLYSINGIDSQIEKVCQKQKVWIDSLKRYATLITQSGEMQRFEYFNKQRELVAKMGTNTL